MSLPLSFCAVKVSLLVRTGNETVPAPHALVLVNKDNPILAPRSRRSGTDPDTGCVLTMIAQHRIDEFCHRRVFAPLTDKHPIPEDTRGQKVSLLARQSTTVAAHTPGQIYNHSHSHASFPLSWIS